MTTGFGTTNRHPSARHRWFGPVRCRCGTGGWGTVRPFARPWTPPAAAVGHRGPGACAVPKSSPCGECSIHRRRRADSQRSRRLPSGWQGLRGGGRGAGRSTAEGRRRRTGRGPPHPPPQRSPARMTMAHGAVLNAKTTRTASVRDARASAEHRPPGDCCRSAKRRPPSVRRRVNRRRSTECGHR